MFRMERQILLLVMITLALGEQGVYEVNTGEPGEGKSINKLPERAEDNTMSDPKDKKNDQDMFLGDYIKGFRKLDASEQKKRLEELLKTEIDSDKDGLISEDELRDRYRNMNRKYRRQEVEETLKKQDDDFDGKVSWEEFSREQYDEEDKEDKERDEKKFRHADMDGDNKLDVNEYFTYHHPLDDPRMVQFSIDQELNKYDTDQDGKISLAEFENSDTFDGLTEETKKELKLDFDENYDQNHDGKLDKQELIPWSITDAEFIRDSPRNLVRDGDTDKDGKLSAEEIYKNLTHFLDAPLNMRDYSDKPMGIENKNEIGKRKDSETEQNKPRTEL